MSAGSQHFCGSVLLGAATHPSDHTEPEIFFRGYLANLVELAQQTGCELTAGCSATDVIRQCYKRWGRSLPTALDGQFALVIVDNIRGDVLVTRDALGVVPLFWSLHAGRLRFATKLSDLVDGKSRSALNLKEVRRYILFGSVSDVTVYSSICRLRPGTSLWVHKGSVTSDVTWDPRCVKPIVRERSCDYVEQFLELVEKSVEGALRNYSSAWIALSGGLDSNTVLSPALRCCSGLKAFSIISPQWPEEDESKWIERIARSRGVPWHPIDAEDVLPFSDFPKDFCGSPDTGVINLRFRRAVGEFVGTNVLLTGDGGDSFMGSRMGPVPSHLADLVFAGAWPGAIREMIPWVRQSRPSRSVVYWLFHGLVLPTVRHLLRRNVRPPHYHLHPPWLQFGKNCRFSSRAAQPPSVAPHCRTPGQQALLDDLWQCAEDAAFDRSYLSRHPLFCRPLFEFLWAIPWSQKQLPLCDRYLQRRALKGIVDDDIRVRVGTGLGSRTLVEGLRRSKQWQEYLCESPVAATLGLVDAENWRQAIRQASVGQTKAEPLLVRAIGVEVWLKQLAQFRPAEALSVAMIRSRLPRA